MRGLRRASCGNCVALLLSVGGFEIGGVELLSAIFLARSLRFAVIAMSKLMVMGYWLECVL